MKKLRPFFENRLLYAGAFVLVLVIVGSSLSSSVRRLNELGRTKAPVSQFVQVRPSLSPGQQWVRAFLKSPDGSKGWSQSTGVRDEIFNEPGCARVDYMSQTLFAGSSSRNGSAVTVLVVIPGRSRPIYQAIKKSMVDCGMVTASEQGSFKTAEGTFTFLGDVVIRTKNTTPTVLSKAATTLSESGCRELMPSMDDFRRNLFYSEKEYTGRIVSDQVKTKVSTRSIPQPVYPMLKTEPWMQEPEGPLPKTFDKLPTPRARPVAPTNPDMNRPSFVKGYDYQWSDPYGPGCGWRWSGFVKPVVDLEVLKSLRDRERRDTQNTLDGDVRQYIDDKIEFSKSSFSVMQAFAEWNDYVTEVEKVHQQWRELEEERRRIEPEWRRFVEAYDYWTNFYRLRANAQKEYDEAVTLCEQQDRELQDWEEEWGEEYDRQQREALEPDAEETIEPEPSPEVTEPVESPEVTEPTESRSPDREPRPTSTVRPSTKRLESSTEPSGTMTLGRESSSSTTEPVDVPEPPQGCLETPERPEIIDQSRPERPTPPQLSEDVTIPASWPRPISSPNVELQ